jgi:hypothetical protein
VGTDDDSEDTNDDGQSNPEQILGMCGDVCMQQASTVMVALTAGSV